MKTTDNQNIELHLLLEAIFLKYGYDFRHYSKGSLKRRIASHMAEWRMSNLLELAHKVLHDAKLFEALLLDLSINVTEMFRDPVFFRSLRNGVLPALRKLPMIKVWHAGCATGEEVYSTAVILQEEGLYDRSRLFATDFNQAVLRRAKEGIFSIDKIKIYTANYQKAGGRESFADYYSAHYDSAVMRRALKKNLIFASHDLATDGIFGDMDLIMCRNVLIYFERDLQNRALRLFRDSLTAGGFLCLGSKESLQFSDCADAFDTFAPHQKIYRKK